MPVVVEGDVGGRHDEIALVDHLIALDHLTAEQQPVGALAAGRERPHAFEPVAGAGP